MLTDEEIAVTMLKFAWTDENAHIKMGRAIESIVRELTIDECARLAKVTGELELSRLILALKEKK
jgi:hypothetical protein